MNYLELELARAKAKNADDLWSHPEWMMEEKLNGWRFAMHFGRDLERTYLTGRRTSSRTGILSEKGLLVPQLWINATTNHPSLNYTVIDGEIMAPSGSGFHDIAAFMNADADNVQKMIAKHGPPTYHAFDLLYIDGQDVRDEPMMERRRLLSRLAPTLRNPLIRLVSQTESSRDIYQSIVDRGGEGVILKNISAAYGESGGWIKVKRFSTLDVIITGFTAARHGRTGKYVGQIGAARVSVRGGDGTMLEVAQVSGMTDEIRRDMTNSPASWIGQVIEIEAQEYGQERLLHPRFKRLRPDADPRHATFEKMMDDLGTQKEKRVVRGEQRELPL